MKNSLNPVNASQHLEGASRVLYYIEARASKQSIQFGQEREMIQKRKNSFRVQKFITLFIVISAFLLQFIAHGRGGDDWPNSQRFNWIVFRYGNLTLESFLNDVQFGINSWVFGQGRFFPVNVITESAYFTLFRTDFSRNVVHLIVYIIFILVWVTLVKMITRDNRVLTFFLFAIVGTTRFRWDFDPHIGFGNLLPLTLLFIGLSILFLLKAINCKSIFKKVVFSNFSGLIFLLSLMTYELSIFLFPAMMLFVLFYNSTEHARVSFLIQRIHILIPLSVCSIGYLWLVFGNLRKNADATGAYVIGFDIVQSTKIFLLNLVAPIPLLTTDFTKIFSLPQSPFGVSVFILGTIGIFMIYSVILNVNKWKNGNKWSNNQTSSPGRLSYFIKHGFFLIPLSMICAPALMLSLQPAWWPRMKWGNSYLGILMQELGLAIILTLLFSALIQDIDDGIIKKAQRKIVYKRRNISKLKKTMHGLNQLRLF